MDASVWFAQSFDDLQSVQQLVGTFNPQELLPAEALPILHTHTHTRSVFDTLIKHMVTQEQSGG